MLKARVMTAGDIQTIDYIGGSESLRKELVNDLASRMIMSDEFVFRFQDIITPEVFSNSPYLQLDLIKKYPGLFDKNVWASSKKKSLETLFSPFILDKLNDELREIAFSNFDVSRLAGPEGKNIKYEDLKDIDGIRSVILPIFPEAVSDLTKSDMKKISEEIFNMASISDHLKDKTILERLIKNKETLNAEFFFLAVLNSNNIGWQNRMLREAWGLNWEQIGATSDTPKKVFLELAEDQIAPAIALMREYAPNFISYDSLGFLLQSQEISEPTVLEILDLFISRGLRNELADYCKDRDYSAALLKLTI